MLAHHIFRENTYDEVVLEYLTKYFEGPVDEMIRVWERSMGFSIEAYELEEDILTYSMFTRIYHPKDAAVLKDYVKLSGKEQVILAYLSFASFQYFVGGKEAEEFIFRSLEHVRKKGWEYNKWEESRLETARSILTICARTGLKFAFFQELPRTLLQSMQLEDKVFAQCQASPRADVTIYYRMLQADREPGEFKKEPLKNLYQGIYNKEFILFYGEVLEYYFTVSAGGEVKETGKNKLTVPEAKLEGTTKYQMINRMLAAKQQGREQELMELLGQYRQQEAWVSSLFELIE